MDFELSNYKARRRCKRCPFGWDRPNDDNNWCDRCEDTQSRFLVGKLVTGVLAIASGGENLSEESKDFLKHPWMRGFDAPITYILGPNPLGEDKQN